MLFCVGGVPSVYYGDEQALRGVKEEREGGDDAIRPAFPVDPSQFIPNVRWSYHLHQRLIGFRRRRPWLVRARTVAETAVAGVAPDDPLLVPPRSRAILS